MLYVYPKTDPVTINMTPAGHIRGNLLSTRDDMLAIVMNHPIENILKPRSFVSIVKRIVCMHLNPKIQMG